MDLNSVSYQTIRCLWNLGKCSHLNILFVTSLHVEHKWPNYTGVSIIGTCKISENFVKKNLARNAQLWSKYIAVIPNCPDFLILGVPMPHQFNGQGERWQGDDILIPAKLHLDCCNTSYGAKYLKIKPLSNIILANALQTSPVSKKLEWRLTLLLINNTTIPLYNTVQTCLLHMGIIEISKTHQRSPLYRILTPFQKWHSKLSFNHLKTRFRHTLL